MNVVPIFQVISEQIGKLTSYCFVLFFFARINAKMKQFLLIIFSTLITTYANCSNIDLMYLTRDFLLKFNQPKQITVFANCWKYGKI